MIVPGATHFRCLGCNERKPMDDMDIPIRFKTSGTYMQINGEVVGFCMSSTCRELGRAFFGGIDDDSTAS